MIPKIGLLVCNSGASNTGTLTGIAAMEIIKEFEDIGIFSLPALVNKAKRQLSLIKKTQRIVIVDGCKNLCAKKIAEKLGISYRFYLNLEHDLKIKKLGPFTSLQYSNEEINKVKTAIEEIIGKIRNEDYK